VAPGAEPTPVVLASIGHSNHRIEHFLELLTRAGIEVVADVRSQPRSRFSPQFSGPGLQGRLRQAGIRYLALGEALGGRPAEPSLYDPEGRVRYDRVAQLPRFVAGLERLVGGCSRYRVAILCAEENPAACHRRLLIGRALALRGGVEMHHLRGDGSVSTETGDQLLGVGWLQPSLFGSGGEVVWRSVHPVPGHAPVAGPAEGGGGHGGAWLG